ncbi:MAG: magnesium/cobalt transporter CorA [Methanobacterium sp.]
MKMYGKRNKKPGLPPGSIIYTGKKDIETKISLIEYDKDNFNQKIIEKCPEFENKDNVTWIKINGFSEIEKLKDIGRCFNLHSLVLEDVLNTNQRSKIDDFEDYLYLVLKIIDEDDEYNVTTKQISLILKKDVLISFQDDEDKIFDLIIKRLKSKETQIRNRGADYLLYSLIDVVIDSYFFNLEKLEDRMGVLEEDLIKHPEPNVLNKIHDMKMDIITFRKAIWPLREILSNFGSYNYSLIDKSTDYFIRDVYDHSILVFEMLESFRDRISDMLDIYLSSTSNKLNEIVRVLTVISTIFVPLTFIVGLYGMNFRFMPEIEYPYSYPLILSGMVLIAVSMLIYFRRKKWI